MARFSVNYRFHGTATEIIEAGSLKEATATIEEKLENDDFDLDPDEIDDVNYEIRQMYPVTRDGREIWTTYVLSTDRRGHPSALLDTPLFGAPR